MERLSAVGHVDSAVLAWQVAAQGRGTEFLATAGAVPRVAEFVVRQDADVSSAGWGTVVEDMVGAEGAEVVEVGWGGRGDDGQSRQLSELDGPDAGGRAAAMDENGEVLLSLAGQGELEAVVKTETLADILACCLEGYMSPKEPYTSEDSNGNGRSLDKVDIVRNLDRCGRLDENRLAERAGVVIPAVSIPGGNCQQSLAWGIVLPTTGTHPPWQRPATRSPFWYCVTFLPTSSTTPA